MDLSTLRKLDQGLVKGSTCYRHSSVVLKPSRALVAPVRHISGHPLLSRRSVRYSVTQGRYW